MYEKLALIPLLSLVIQLLVVLTIAKWPVRKLTDKALEFIVTMVFFNLSLSCLIYTVGFIYETFKMSGKTLL